MANCPACGAVVGHGETVCPECGLRLEGATESFTPVTAEQAEAIAEFGDAEGPVLVVRKGSEVGQRFYVDRDTLTIGRDPVADIFLNDVTVSRRHAVVSRTGPSVSVEDVGSLNGTYVNGVCVDKAELMSGDVLQVGMFQMVFLAGPKGA